MLLSNEHWLSCAVVGRDLQLRSVCEWKATIEVVVRSLYSEGIDKVSGVEKLQTNISIWYFAWYGELMIEAILGTSVTMEDGGSKRV